MQLLGKLNSDYYSGFNSCRPGTIVIVELSYLRAGIAIAVTMVAYFDPMSLEQCQYHFISSLTFLWAPSFRWVNSTHPRRR